MIITKTTIHVNSDPQILADTLADMRQYYDTKHNKSNPKDEARKIALDALLDALIEQGITPNGNTDRYAASKQASADSKTRSIFKKPAKNKVA